MGTNVLTVLLIEDSAEYAELVQAWLSPRTDQIEFILNWTDTLAGGLKRLDQGGVDVILLDLGLPDSRGLKTFATARIHSPGVPIVILSGVDTESLALQMIQQGAQDYILKTACNEETLAKALQYAVGRSGQTAPEDRAPEQVIGVMGAKGGVGATTFACNLAIELRRETDQSVLLADLDVNSGLVSFLMNTEAKQSILDAAANIQRLDRSLWDAMVAHAPGGVDILGSPGLLGAENADVSKIEDSLAVIRNFYRWTVLDLGRLTSLSLSLLDRVSELYLITMLSVPALYEAKRTIAAVTRAGLDADRLRLIIVQAGTTQEFSGSELVRLFSIPVYAKLPGAARELDDASTKGKFPGADSAYRIRVASVARRIAGLPEEASRGPVSQLRSFVGKLRGSPRDAAEITRSSP
jgi:Flp pilus assembly CpaE family ATPase